MCEPSQTIRFMPCCLEWENLQTEGHLVNGDVVIPVCVLFLLSCPMSFLISFGALCKIPEDAKMLLLQFSLDLKFKLYGDFGSPDRILAIAFSAPLSVNRSRVISGRNLDLVT